MGSSLNEFSVRDKYLGDIRAANDEIKNYESEIKVIESTANITGDQINKSLKLLKHILTETKRNLNIFSQVFNNNVSCDSEFQEIEGFKNALSFVLNAATTDSYKYNDTVNDFKLKTEESEIKIKNEDGTVADAIIKTKGTFSVEGSSEEYKLNYNLQALRFYVDKLKKDLENIKPLNAEENSETKKHRKRNLKSIIKNGIIGVVLATFVVVAILGLRSCAKKEADNSGITSGAIDEDKEPDSGENEGQKPDSGEDLNGIISDSCESIKNYQTKVESAISDLETKSADWAARIGGEEALKELEKYLTDDESLKNENFKKLMAISSEETSYATATEAVNADIDAEGFYNEILNDLGKIEDMVEGYKTISFENSQIKNVNFNNIAIGYARGYEAQSVILNMDKDAEIIVNFADDKGNDYFVSFNANVEKEISDGEISIDDLQNIINKVDSSECESFINYTKKVNNSSIQKLYISNLDAALNSSKPITMNYKITIDGQNYEGNIKAFGRNGEDAISKDKFLNSIIEAIESECINDEIEAE